MSELRTVPCNDCIELAPMIEEILADLSPVAEKKGGTLECDGTGTMVGSDTLIYRLIFNLTENAIRYNRPDGTVRVSVSQEGDDLVVRVADTGCGIPEQYKESIFQPFFRVDKSRSRENGGVGLGLSLVWEIADIHGGKVQAEESTEKGTVMTVTFPLNREYKDDYPSTPAFIHMMDKGIKFIVRLKSSDYKKEQSSLSENDQLVKIKLDKSRIRHDEGTIDGERMKELGEISLRMIKIPLENESLEVLATNLSEIEFSTNEIKELYHMRWGIETAYETLKSRLQLENFTGTKAILLLQDIYSTIYLSNLAEDIILDAERELDQKETEKKHKMMINQTVTLRFFSIYIKLKFIWIIDYIIVFSIFHWMIFYRHHRLTIFNIFFPKIYTHIQTGCISIIGRKFG